MATEQGSGATQVTRDCPPGLRRGSAHSPWRAPSASERLVLELSRTQIVRGTPPGGLEQTQGVLSSLINEALTNAQRQLLQPADHFSLPLVEKAIATAT